MYPLDTIKLLTLVTIAKEGSFIKAAQYLKITQPTVSQQIAALEKTIGTTLIIRRMTGSQQPRGIKLTEAGEVLVDYAERILELNDQARRATLSAAGLAERTLNIGVGHTLAIYLLPDLLHRLRQQTPPVEVQIRAGNTSDLLAATADGKVNLALVGLPALVGTPNRHTHLTITPFCQDELVLIVSPNDVWRDKQSVTLADLRERTFLTREPGAALHASVSQLLGVDYIYSSQTIILGATEAIKRSVEAGLGVALIQGIAIQREISQGILHTIPLEGVDITRTYNIVQRSDYTPSPVTQHLIDLLQTEGTPNLSKF